MYVSSTIAKISKQQGFKNEVSAFYRKDRLYNIYSNENVNVDKESVIAAPTYEELIKWIFTFPLGYVQGFDDNEEEQDNYNLTITVEWLKFWYNALIPEIQDNEFILEAFTGMLLNWFKKNGYHLLTNKIYDKPNSDELGWFFKIYDISNIKETKPIFQSESIFNTKIEARHQGILKIFKLLKSLNYEI